MPASRVIPSRRGVSRAVQRRSGWHSARGWPATTPRSAPADLGCRGRTVVHLRRPDLARARRRGDVPRWAGRAAAAVAAPPGDGGRRRAQRLQGRPLGPAAAHQPLPGRDHVRHRRRRRAGHRQVRSVHRRVRGAAQRGRRTPPATRTCCDGCTSPRSAPSCRPSRPTPPRRSPPRRPTCTSHRPTRPPSLLGATDLPTTVAGLDELIASYRPELESTPAAREATRFMLLNPPVPLVLRPGLYRGSPPAARNR